VRRRRGARAPVSAAAADVDGCALVGENVDGHGGVDLQLVILRIVNEISNQRAGDADPVTPVRDQDVVGVTGTGLTGSLKLLLEDADDLDVVAGGVRPVLQIKGQVAVPARGPAWSPQSPRA